MTTKEDNLSRPEVFGPGSWFAVHLFASMVDKYPEHRTAFVVFMQEFLSGSLPCLNCRGHCKQYISDNQISKDNLLLWSHTFHNAVNQRLNKSTNYTYQDLRSFLARLASGEGCSNCGESVVKYRWKRQLIE